MKKYKLALASALLLGSSGAMAASITNTAGTFGNFGGFDWAQNGAAVVDGFDATQLTGLSDTFDLTYFANAVAVTDVSGGNILGTSIPMLSGDFEYTIVATLNETSTCTADNGLLCTAADFTVNSGSFDIWYDVADNADTDTGAGFTDGDLLISGTIIGGVPGGGFDIFGGGSSATLFATIDYTNSLYINPDLITSTAVTTLQLGADVTTWTEPTSMPAAGGGTQALPANPIMLQADGNQSFTAKVPEPQSLALLGLGLLGLGLVRRRKNT